MVLVIGHRGAAGYEPENTMRSFRRAVELGCHMLELDVHLARDGELVVMHDETVDRTTNGSGRVSGMETGELMKLDAGKGERIPLLTEVLDVFGGACDLNVELKGRDTSGPAAELLVSYINKGAWKREALLVSSFSPVELKDFSELGTGIPAAVLIDGIPHGAEEFAVELGCAAVHPNHLHLEPDFVRTCHDLGLRVNVWTPNTREEMGRCLRMGVDGLITDLPDTALEMISLHGSDP